MRWPHQACSCQTYRPEVMLPAAVSRIGGIRGLKCLWWAWLPFSGVQQAGREGCLEPEKGVYKFRLSPSEEGSSSPAFHLAVIASRRTELGGRSPEPPDSEGHCPPGSRVTDHP